MCGLACVGLRCGGRPAIEVRFRHGLENQGPFGKDKDHVGAIYRLYRDNGKEKGSIRKTMGIPGLMASCGNVEASSISAIMPAPSESRYVPTERSR